MSECYPTGCTPCTSPIEFPEMPADGDRHCVPIGSNGEQKCWVYDKCIPGWRAEGPATSPTRYLGLINPCGTPPADDVKAGDWYIISADKADICIQDPRWGLNLGDFKQGDRIAYNGTTWQTFPPPDVPYAEEALDTTPNPDNRVGGIVKNASLADAIAGTKKCDAITPYTLKETIKNSDFIDDVLDPIIDARIGDGTLTITVDGTDSTFTANQDTDTSVSIPAPGNGTVTFTQAGTEIGSITMNQSGNTTLEFTDNVSGPGAEVPGQFAAMINGTQLKFARGISSMARINKGVYQYNFETEQTGISFDNVFYQVSTNSGGSPTMAASIGMHILDKDKFIVLTGYNNESPADQGNQTISIWRLS